jgi:poly(3-hydroxybutyrate) depolymerase
MHTNHLASSQAYTADFHRPGQVTSGRVTNGHPYVMAAWHTDDGNEVQSYWKIGGMGHAWSGGDPAGSYTDPRGPNASVAMYNFFMAHPMKKADRQSIVARRVKQRYTDLDSAVS